MAKVLVFSIIESNLAYESVGVYADTAEGLAEAMKDLAVVLCNSGFIAPTPSFGALDIRDPEFTAKVNAWNTFMCSVGKELCTNLPEDRNTDLIEERIGPICQKYQVSNRDFDWRVVCVRTPLQKMIS